MTETLDPTLMLAEGERMARVLRMLEGFVYRPAGVVRLTRPSLMIDPEPEPDGGADGAPTPE